MQESTVWTWGTLSGLALFGATLAGAIYAAPPAFIQTQVGAESFLAGLLFFILFLAPALAMQLYRRGHDHSTLVGGLGGAAFTFTFFGSIVAMSSVQAAGQLDVGASIMFVIVAPLIVGGLSASGTLYLARGVERYRAENGLKHAPAQR